MKTRVTELLGIEYPIIQGGMAWVATHELASAVSNAGGLGIIGAGGAPASRGRGAMRFTPNGFLGFFFSALICSPTPAGLKRQ